MTDRPTEHSVLAGPRRAARPARARRHPEAGVTLIEMMVVLVIIAVVAALIVPNVIGRPDEARVTVARTDIRTIASALELYRLDNRAYPTTTQGLEALARKPVSPPVPENWVAGGYLQQVPVDPWGNPYGYRAPGTDAPFDLLSLGADGQPGGEGAAADILHGAQVAAQ
ncbi:type II secretion system major pseudopilin GspG [Oceaniglobus trochenteri]|uniref:type II secretion system major pseudopilin GspG n=1 Tax=Oceaniglobus trochenteri TaxID=2763260 RepID=UPI001CFFB082|nr:type II secretion system major pseudopilin GspG [Oceaniglobus trochenteri]